MIVVADSGPLHYHGPLHRPTEAVTRRQDTTTARGQVLDWVPIESQHPRGEIASPPPTYVQAEGRLHGQEEHQGVPELLAKDEEKGPAGTVPILRKRLDATRSCTTSNRTFTVARRGAATCSSEDRVRVSWYA